jgi:hypothetical protein
MVRGGKAGLKVVAHLRGGKLVKGYTEAVPIPDLEALLQQESPRVSSPIKIRLADSKRTISIPMKSLKALFFVKSFEGRKEYKEIKFFETHPPIEGLWVRMQFYDRETTEGVVRNSLDLLMSPGFFVKPPDPESNNEILYVVKSSLTAFQVQGVKARY